MFLVVGGILFEQIDAASGGAGGSRASGVRAHDSAVYCWGDSLSGQLGNGTKDDAIVVRREAIGGQAW